MTKGGYAKISNKQRKKDKMIGKLGVYIFVVVVFSMNLITEAQTSPSESDVIIGSWMMSDEEGIIQIFKEGENYSGKIIWMKEKEADGSPLKDRENPDESLRERTVEGLKVMTGFKYLGDGVWGNGEFYAAKKGKTVEPDFILEDKNHLNIEISIFIFSLSIELTRVDASKFLLQKNDEY